MKSFLLIFLITTTLFSSKVENYRWQDGETYLSFLERIELPTKKLYYDLNKDEQMQTEEMRTGINYHILRDSNKVIQQILLSLNDELQIHIYLQEKQYKFEIIPIISSTKIESFKLQINHSPHYDILKKTGSNKMAKIFISSFKNSLNFKKDLRQGNMIVMIYEQKYRTGIRFSMPTLKAAMIETRSKKHFIYHHTDERYYNKYAQEIRDFLLARPVRKARISSKFTKRRFHPILKKWRAHLGVDYAARRGTPVFAAGNGTVLSTVRSSSYGNLIKIRHKDGYETRYAHLKSFRRGVKKGRYVNKGSVIGYVGSTGRSTGPHLHFELRKNGRAIDPLKIVQVTIQKLKGKKKTSFLKIKSKYDKDINESLLKDIKFEKEDLVSECYFSV